MERQLELYKTGIIPQASLQIKSAMSSYRVNKADFMTLLDSQMTLYKYELEYHQALTEYEKNVAGLGAVIGKQSLKKGEVKMKRWIFLALLFVLPGFIFGCGKGKEASKQEGHKEEEKQEVKQEAKKGDDLDLKNLTMESIQKEGKVQEVSPGAVQISPEKQQLIGVKFGTVEIESP